jgi:hypothetical protein
VQQVNLRIPEDTAAGATTLTLCGTSAANGKKTCSPAFALTVRR